MFKWPITLLAINYEDYLIEIMFYIREEDFKK